MNAGLPPAAALRWRVLTSRHFPSAAAADRHERRLLDLAAAQRWSLGGEFVMGPVADIRRALDASDA
jgi:hypothetical protein